MKTKNPLKRMEILENHAAGFKPQEIEEMARYFLKHPFWTEIFRPALELQLLEEYEQLRLVDLSMIKAVRRGMAVLEMMMEFPELRLLLAQSEREMEEENKEQKPTVDTSRGLATTSGTRGPRFIR